MDAFLQLLPGLMPSIVVALGLTKIIKNAYQSAKAWRTGVYEKLPPWVTRILAVVLPMVAALIAGTEADLSLITDEALGGALAAALVALLNSLKKPRSPEPISG